MTQTASERPIALVTGASAGLGYAIAEGLARAGARLVLNGRDEKKLAGAVDALRVEGFKAGAAAPYFYNDAQAPGTISKKAGAQVL